jgi:hypothetical protein
MMLRVTYSLGMANESIKEECKLYHKKEPNHLPSYCLMSDHDRFEKLSGGFGGFNHSLPVASLPPDSLGNEFISFSM